MGGLAVGTCVRMTLLLLVAGLELPAAGCRVPLPVLSPISRVGKNIRIPLAARAGSPKPQPASGAAPPQRRRGRHGANLRSSAAAVQAAAQLAPFAKSQAACTLPKAQRPAGTTVRWNGMDAFAEQYSINGSQQPTEPSDMALCVGKHYVVQAVNTAVAVYDAFTGALLAGPLALGALFGLSPAYDTTTKLYGDTVGDPRCIYDAGSKDFVLIATRSSAEQYEASKLAPKRIDRPTSIMLAITSNPLKAWTVWALDTSNDGQKKTINFKGFTPITADYPHLGADANVYTVTANLFGTGEFDEEVPIGSSIYLIPKALLASRASSGFVALYASTPTQPWLMDAKDSSTLVTLVAPALVPPNGPYDTSHNGRLSFVSTMAYSPQHLATKIAVWRIDNTRVLNAPKLSMNRLQKLVIRLKVVNVPKAPYLLPAFQYSVAQRRGPSPATRDCGLDGNVRLDAGDERVLTAVYAAGKIWAAANTLIRTKCTKSTQVASVYWVLDNQSLDVLSSGYVVPPGRNSVLYPAFSINGQSGRGTLAVSLAGPDFYPSVAHAPFDKGTLVPGPLRLIQRGYAPYDSLFACTAYEIGTSRWGDYNAGTVDEFGRLWVAIGYVGPNGFHRRDPQTLQVNWGSYIFQLKD